MERSNDSRRPVTDPRSRMLMGLSAAVLIVAADAWVSGLHPVRCALSAVMTLLGYWLLTPTAELSERTPLRAGVLAAFFGAGVGAAWWALTASTYAIWIPLSIGSGVALLSLAPVESGRPNPPGGRPRKGPAVAARRLLHSFISAKGRVDESTQSKQRRTTLRPSV